MTLLKELGSCRLARDKDGKVHILDLSDVKPESVQQALEAYYRKYNLTPLEPYELERRGYHAPELRLDRISLLVKNRR